MARRNDHSREEIRSMALNAAQRIIVQDGFDKLSARKIASQMGYTQGTLYLVFENLDDLIIHLNARTLDELYQSLQSVVVNAPLSAETLHALGSAYLQFAQEHTQRWRLIFDHRLPYLDTPDWFQDKVQEGFGMIEQVLAKVATERSESEIKRAARALWGGVHGVCMLAMTGKLADPEGGEVQVLVDSLIECYLRGFTQQPL